MVVTSVKSTAGSNSMREDKTIIQQWIVIFIRFYRKKNIY